MKKLKDKEWERQNSTVGKIFPHLTYNKCREVACKNIAHNLTKIDFANSRVVDLPKGIPFTFLVRVDTRLIHYNDPKYYYNQFKRRSFVSFSTITNKNCSHYGLGGNVLFAYNIPPSAIAHVFPIDSDTCTNAKTEDELTYLPSLWLNLEELNNATLKLGSYNQVTCKTKIKGSILKPFAVIAIGEPDPYSAEVAKAFGIGYVIIHPDDDAIMETFDPHFPIKDDSVLKAEKIKKKISKMYGLYI